jgi:pimeloyl-ACP methyl ester carboxylesterase
MKRALVDGIDLEYQIHGTGEPVVLVHHGAGVDWFLPMLNAPALRERFSMIAYHRAGYEGSGPLRPPLTFEKEAATFRGFVRELGYERVHVVGHSASACLAIEMALSAPDSVQSLALFEPALMAVASPPEVPRAIELYRAGDTVAAVDTFLSGTCGPNHRPVLEKMLPNAIEQALANAATFFQHELPALRQWSFGPERARGVHQPVLAVLGERSDSRFHQRQQLLKAWLPHLEEFILPRAGHLLHLENLDGMAVGLASFLARHPISVAA